MTNFVTKVSVAVPEPSPRGNLPTPGSTSKPDLQQLNFSRHLADRLNRRRLHLSGERIDRLTRAVDRVAGKGGQDSVVFLDDLALLVNVPSRTVVTAIETGSMKEGVFTNIDSVVVG